MLLTHLEKQKILTAPCHKVTEQFLEFIDYDLKVNIVKFENFSANDTNLDNFYFRFIRIEKYKELSFLVKIVLTLSDGQASVECSFSLNKLVLNHNMRIQLLQRRPQKITRFLMVLSHNQLQSQMN